MATAPTAPTAMTGIVENLQALATSLDELHLLEGNPRVGDVGAVAASLARFGQRKPIVARTDGTVIAGNHTLQAARQLGWTHIAVVRVDDDDATAKAFALADNRTAELGGYDDVALEAMVRDVLEFDAELLADTGWAGEDLEALLVSSQVRLAPVTGDPDAVPSVPKSPVSVPGDVWLLGPHRLACGDSSTVEALDAVLQGERAQMIWTDPPYGVSYVGGTADALTIENDGADDVAQLLADTFGLALAHTDPGAVWYVAAPSGPANLPFAQVLTDLGVWRQTLIWVKDRFVLGHSDYHYRHEDLFYGWSPDDEPVALPPAEYEVKHEPLMYGWTPGAAHQGTPDRRQDTIWEVPRPSASVDHPTMKPVALIDRAIRNSSKPGAVVLDPFGGSGSTLIAAHMVGRQARLIELDPRYCDVICRRYQQATGDKPIAEATGRPHDFEADQ
jgi:DNA modification methylase